MDAEACRNDAASTALGLGMVGRSHAGLTLVGCLFRAFPVPDTVVVRSVRSRGLACTWGPRRAVIRGRIHNDASMQEHRCVFHG